MRKILLSGYYGYNNAGDEAILKSIIQNIKSIDNTANITVLSDNIEFTKSKYGINAVKRFNVIHIIKSLLSCDILISGGGTLFQDKTSTRSLIYYTSIINLAKFFGKKVMIYANGIGPLEKKKNINRVKKSIQNSDIITLRDKEAMQIVENMNIVDKKIYLTTDPVFCLSESNEDIVNNIIKENNIDDSKDFVIISVRSWEKQGEFTNLFAKTCDYIIDTYNKNVIFLILQQPHDFVATQTITKKMKNKSYIIQNIVPVDMMGLMKKASYVISMRLHGLIFASSVSTPVLGFSYDPKIDNLLKQIDMPCASKIENMSFDDMKKSVDDIEKNLSSYKTKMQKNIISIKEMAKKNYDYMKEIIQM